MVARTRLIVTLYVHCLSCRHNNIHISMYYCWSLFILAALFTFSVEFICYAQRSKTLIERAKRSQRFVACEDMPWCELSFKLTVYKFSNLLIKNTCNVGLMKNNGEAHFFLQELFEWHLDLLFTFSERHLHFLWMQYLLQWQLTNPCLLSRRYHWGWPKR